jgi:phospholipid transport system transporter-binding protein
VSLQTQAIVLPSTLRHEQAMDWLNTLPLPAAQESEVIIDASELTSFDSTALACLIEVRRRAQMQSTRVQITGLPERLLRLAKVYGLADLL